MSSEIKNTNVSDIEEKELQSQKLSTIDVSISQHNLD